VNKGWFETVKLLIERGADCNLKQHFQSLIEIAQKKNFKKIEELLKNQIQKTEI
jgi:hypothetical protein